MQRQQLIRLGVTQARTMRQPSALVRSHNPLILASCHRYATATEAPPIPDKLAESESGGGKGGAKGRTGGGEPLSSSANAPAPPKVENASVPSGGRDTLSEEQQREVDQHNKDFDAKHDRAQPAADDKVDKGYWKVGEGGRT